MPDGEAQHWILEESFRILLPLLEELVGMFLILCGVFIALALALYVSVLVAEFRKARQ